MTTIRRFWFVTVGGVGPLRNTLLWYHCDGAKVPAMFTTRKKARGFKRFYKAQNPTALIRCAFVGVTVDSH